MKTGGRGKAGGVKLADSPDEAQATAGQILGLDIKGHRVNEVLVEQASDIAPRVYLSFLLDPLHRPVSPPARWTTAWRSRRSRTATPVP